MTQQITHQPADFICLCGRHSATMALHNYHQAKCSGVLAGQGTTPTDTVATYSVPTPEPAATGIGKSMLVRDAVEYSEVSPWVFTERGEEVIRELMMCAVPHNGKPPVPCLLMGESGYGKSVVVREVARRLGRKYSALNAHPGMDISLIVGQMLPRPAPGGGITLEWEHGVLTTSIMNGDIFLFEEVTRAPMETISRMFGPLDEGFGYYNIPEAAIDNIPINPNWWFVGTANPAGRGYQTARLDPALESRFGYQIEVNEPLADEAAIVSNLLPENQYPNVGARLQRFIFDTRRVGNESIADDAGVNTRDLVHAANLISRGFLPETAVERAIISKKESAADGLRMLARAHFQGKHDINTASAEEVINEVLGDDATQN